MLRSLPNNASAKAAERSRVKRGHAPQTRVRPASQLTMEAMAKQAKVGKPTLYKRWPSKAALSMTMFYKAAGWQAGSAAGLDGGRGRSCQNAPVD
jgi:AcrR family transcriptional regulator